MISAAKNTTVVYYPSATVPALLEQLWAYLHRVNEKVCWQAAHWKLKDQRDTLQASKRQNVATHLSDHCTNLPLPYPSLLMFGAIWDIGFGILGLISSTRRHCFTKNKSSDFMLRSELCRRAISTGIWGVKRTPRRRFPSIIEESVPVLAISNSYGARQLRYSRGSMSRDNT